MNFINKIQYNNNWNIGFSNQTSSDFVNTKSLRKVNWLKHPYHDRWFADPFILSVDEDEIVVFVEECPMDNPKGVLCELVVDRKTFNLKKHYVILELDTHLSYPAIIRHENKIYVYPENGASGKLNLYEYDGTNHRLINPVCILNEAVADASILEYDGHFYLSATKFPETQERAFLYVSDSLFGPFVQVGDSPYQISKRCSRQGGNWIQENGSIYRPAQDCVERYGSALTMMKVRNPSEGICEEEYFQIPPVNGRYGLGLHTIDFLGDMCVIDGFGHFYPLLGKIYYSSIIHGMIDCLK